MEKRTLYAVILSVIVITIGFTVQNLLYPPEPVPATAPATPAPQPGAPAADPQATPGPATDAPRPAPTFADGTVRAVPQEGISRQTRVFQNDVLRVTFTPEGGAVQSFELLEHLERGNPVEMAVTGSAADQNGFLLKFGGPDAPPVTDLFTFRRTDNPNVIEFYRDFYFSGRPEAPFRVVRRYVFQPGEYLFELQTTIENSVNEFIALDSNGIAYTITTAPQIGPSFTQLDGRQEFRRFLTHTGGRRRTVNVSSGSSQQVADRVDWAAIAGKYFVLIAVPGAADYRVTFSTVPAPGVPEAHRISVSRPVIRSARNTDTVRFFVGPKTPAHLERYNSANDNAFRTQNLNLDAAMETRMLLGWLENILKFALNAISRVVPNYGIAIIVLTLIVKLLLWPLTHKSYESTARMQSLSPKIQELREKHPDNPQKMNAEMAALYKKEGVNPLGGCLPMLLQFPFFIAMFGLFNNHFELRGASFIPGWIDDLSAPESIWNFGDFTLPFLGWNDLRLLPIVFVGTQILSSKLMQQPQANASQMKMMTYMMPIVFFFVLYNMPSGLLVYWIVTNVLTVGQQYYNNKIKKPAPAPVAAPAARASAAKKRSTKR